MIQLRLAEDRGRFDFGWLDTRHTFSFGEYHAPDHMGFRALRVINEDWVQPGRGFGTHPHRDMEILTVVLEGALEHKDSMGNGSVIRPGRLQRMSAGTGVLHSEHNPSKDEPVHLLQIWILPREHGIAPGYEEREFDDLDAGEGLRLVASPDGRDGSLTVHADAALYLGRLDTGAELEHTLVPGRHAWLQVAKGGVEVLGTKGERHALSAGSGAAFSDEVRVRFRATEPAEVLVFDLA